MIVQFKRKGEKNQMRIRHFACVKFAAVLLSLVLLFSIVPFSAFAASERNAVLTGNQVRIRKGPGTSYPALTQSNGSVIYLLKDTAVTVTGDGEKDAKGELWYPVRCYYNGSNYTGYIIGTYLQIEEAAPSQPEPSGKEETPEETKSYGYVSTTSGARVRTGPGTNFAMVQSGGGNILLPFNYKLDSVGASHPGQDGNSTPWYEITFTYNGEKKSGYMRSDLIRVVKEVTGTVSADFETSIASFPEDYKASLRAIHLQHPTWQFELMDTGLDWNYVQENENVLGRSMTLSEYASFRSTAPGSYNWATDTFYPTEANKFYQAAPAVVAYYMDPRNFLNDVDIFQFEKLSFDPVTQTLEGAQAMLKNSFMEKAVIKDLNGNNTDYAHAFMDSASNANVSVYHLIARCIQEVGRTGTAAGTSGTVQGYEGYYNYFSIGATNGAIPGLQYAKRTDAKYYLPWNTPYKSIMGGGVFISSGYISVGQDTLYLQKFSVAQDKYFWHQYMGYVPAPYNEARNMRSAYVKMDLLETAFTFKIPVFKNMPKTPCALPAPAGSPNNLLKSLSVEGFSLTPSFDYNTTNYTVIIAGDVSSVKVSAAAVSSTATVKGNVGNVAIKTGENLLKITCTSASGSPKVYSIRIVLNGQGSTVTDPPANDDPPVTPPDPVVSSGWEPSFRWDNGRVAGITPGTQISAFLSEKTGVYGNASAEICDASGARVTSGPLRTGYVLRYNDGKTVEEYPILVFGDVSGDSSVDVVDLLMVQKIILNLYSPGAVYKAAADVNHDGEVDVVDLLMVQKSILSLYTISQ